MLKLSIKAVPAKRGGSVVVSGKGRWEGLRAVLIKMPPATLARIDAGLVGPRNQAILALVEYALETLEAEGLSLNVLAEDDGRAPIE